MTLHPINVNLLAEKIGPLKGEREMHNMLSCSITFHPPVMRSLYGKALWGLPVQSKFVFGGKKKRGERGDKKKPHTGRGRKREQPDT